ncbi:MAG: GNAT family N-acetyltransferase [Chloroflexi bacterium]|nr:GNAT family N-acetyltransferase [Chloroflexota bacterium]
MIEPLEGALVRLRPASTADAHVLATVLRDPTVGEWWQVPDVDADVAELLADAELAIWLIEEAGSVLGLVMAGEETDAMYRHASIDIAIAAAGQGRGLGTDAVRTVARWLIERRRHHRVIIDPSATNARAIAAYAKVGFRPVGVLRSYERWRDGTWHDGLLMDLLADELVDP